jgi:hypothetical protein
MDVLRAPDVEDLRRFKLPVDRAAFLTSLEECGLLAKPQSAP